MKVLTFEDGTPEDFCEFRTDVERLAQGLKYTTGKLQINLYKSLLVGRSLDIFHTALSKHIANQPDTGNGFTTAHRDKLLLAQTLNTLAEDIFPNSNGLALRAQSDTCTTNFR